MAFNPEVVKAGTIARQESEETPSTFGTTSGSTSTTPTGRLDKKSNTRFAGGPIGEFALSIIDNPNNLKQLMDWREMFDMSNEGGAFTEFARNGDGGGEEEMA